MAGHRYQVTHWRPDGPDSDRTIDRLRIKPAWDLTPKQVAEYIDQGNEFYIAAPNAFSTDIDLMAMGNALSGRRWVQTKPDGRYDNNIYALPKF